jgi:Flp pilus assembly protein TadG
MAQIRRSGRTGEERGAALVEFALCVPLLLVVIAGIVDFGFAFQRYEVITNAAREGARLATLPQYQGNDAMIKDRVRSYVQQGLSLSSTALDNVLPAAQVVVDNATPLTVTDGTNTFNLPASTVTVTYNHTFLMLQPILGLINKSWGSNISLVARSQMRNEQAFGGGSGS